MSTASTRPSPGVDRTGGNRLLSSLARLAPEESGWLSERLETVELAHAQVLVEAGSTYEHVYFPDSAVLSVISRMADGSAAEVGTMGNEGIAGLPVFLESGATENEVVAQIPGAARRVTAEAFAAGAQEQRTLRRLLNRYTQAYLAQVAQTAACNRLHGIEQRCARWLLMTHDRVGGADQFPLTQEYLAIMLGVRRAGVSVAAGALQDAGLIRYRRGDIQITDRDGLESASCECYGIVRGQFDRLLS